MARCHQKPVFDLTIKTWFQQVVKATVSKTCQPTSEYKKMSISRYTSLSVTSGKNIIIQAHLILCFRQTVEDHLAMEQESAAQEKRSLKALVSSLRRELEEKCLREKQLRDELLHACKQVCKHYSY